MVLQPRADPPPLPLGITSSGFVPPPVQKTGISGKAVGDETSGSCEQFHMLSQSKEAALGH